MKVIAKGISGTNIIVTDVGIDRVTYTRIPAMLTERPLKRILDLKRGDIIRNDDGTSYVVDGNYGNFAIAIRTVCVMNPPEWTVITAEQDNEQDHGRKGST